MSLDGVHALVTGTNRGIGQAIARALRDAGSSLVCHARAETAAREAAAAVDGAPVWGDLSDPAQIRDIASQVGAVTPELGVLVHNAGLLRRGSIDDVSRADIDDVLAVNVYAPVFLTQALLPLLRAAGRARVVVVSSTMGQLSGGMSGGSLPYRLSKTAVHAFVVNTAAELRGDGILVNAMHPGWVQTAMGGPAAPISVEAAAAAALQLASLPDDGPTGGFFRDGKPIPW
jgi:NAD(P)-dependent dehydrogenase (short-subunit alcohol dehydrogenase family)